MNKHVLSMPDHYTGIDFRLYSGAARSLVDGALVETFDDTGAFTGGLAGTLVFQSEASQPAQRTRIEFTLPGSSDVHTIAAVAHDPLQRRGPRSGRLRGIYTSEGTLQPLSRERLERLCVTLRTRIEAAGGALVRRTLTVLEFLS